MSDVVATSWRPETSEAVSRESCDSVYVLNSQSVMALPSLRVEKYHKVYRAVDEKGVDELYALLVVTKVSGTESNGCGHHSRASV
jgi:hypothetical protein